MMRILWLCPLLLFLVAQEGGIDEASKKDLQALQGDWAGISMITDGNKMPPDDAMAYFRTFKGNIYTVFRYQKTLAKWTFTLDATKKPKTIDARPEGDEKAPPALGIYELEGGKFTLCVGGGGKGRPTAFESKAGSGQTLSVWEREKKKPFTVK